MAILFFVEVKSNFGVIKVGISIALPHRKLREEVSVDDTSLIDVLILSVSDLQVQSLPGQGASDVVSFSVDDSCYIVVANSEDNNANPNVDSVVYRWSGNVFVQVQRLSTIGASALATFIHRDELNLAVASLTDTRYAIEVMVTKCSAN